MAVISKSIEREHRLVAHMVPPNVLKSINQSELLDRLVHAQELVRKGQQSGDPVLSRGYGKLAQAVLRAQPRAVTERAAADLVAKAAGAPLTPEAAALRRQAEQIREEHPTAPRREDSAAVAVAKATAGDGSLMVLYDAAGNPFGVCDPAALRPVASPDSVAKVGKARQPARSPARR